MGLFAPFLTRGMPRGHTLTPYTAAVFLTFGALLCCFFFNTIPIRRPIVGTPVSANYLHVPAGYHALGPLGGAIWGWARHSTSWRPAWSGWLSPMPSGRPPHGGLPAGRLRLEGVQGRQPRSQEPSDRDGDLLPACAGVDCTCVCWLKTCAPYPDQVRVRRRKTGRRRSGQEKEERQ